MEAINQSKSEKGERGRNSISHFTQIAISMLPNMQSARTCHPSKYQSPFVNYSKSKLTLGVQKNLEEEIPRFIDSKRTLLKNIWLHKLGRQ